MECYLNFLNIDLKNLFSIFHNCHKRESEVENPSCKPVKIAKVKQDKPAWGVQNYSPVPVIGDNSTTLDKHIDWLKREIVKKETSQNMNKVQLLMDKTFAERRRCILEEDETTVKLKDYFPWPFNTDEVYNITK